MGTMGEGDLVTGTSRASWGEPFARLDEAWQKLEARLCAGVLVAEISALTLWISLKGLSIDYSRGENAAGLVYRCVVTAAFLGALAHLGTVGRSPGVRRGAIGMAISLGAAGGLVWAHAGVAWSSNALNWLQNASALMLLGGLRGLVTRLTLWLALLGASLATSTARHIHVDLLARHLPTRLRIPAAIAGWVAAAVVCTAAVFGFVDYISIAEYRVPAAAPCPEDFARSCETGSAEKLARLRSIIASDFFLLGRQLTLDGRSLPRVIAGHPYDRWLTARAWNAWLDGADWTAHFDPAAVDALRMDASSPDAVRMPQVAVPGSGGEARGVLIRELNFVFPFGLSIIALKLLLCVVLVLAGRPSTPQRAPS